MKWNKMRTKPLCWKMRWGWMTWKWSLAFINDEGLKKAVQKLFTKNYIKNK